MMYKMIITFVLFGASAFGQKPNISVDSYKTWQQVVGGDLSKNGQFAFYSVSNLPIGKRTLFIKTTTGKDILSVIGLNQTKFSEDSKYVVGMLAGDTLMTIDLKTKLVKKIADVINFELHAVNESQRLIYMSKDSVLNVSDFSGKPIYSFANVNHYGFDPLGNSLVIEKQKSAVPKWVNCIWIDTTTGVEKVIYNGEPTTGFIFDGKGHRFAFMTNLDSEKELFYYEKDSNSAKKIVSRELNGIASNLQIEMGANYQFSKDGSRIFFVLSEKEPPAKRLKAADPEIWSYQDRYLRSFYSGSSLMQYNLPASSYLTTVELQNKKMTQLVKNNQKIADRNFMKYSDEYFIVESGVFSDLDSKYSYYLCNVESGNQEPIELEKKISCDFWDVSSNNRYVVYYDPSIKNYVIYNIANKRRNEIKGITSSLISYKRQHYPMPELDPVGTTGWLDSGNSILINGTYDLWLVDATESKPAVNITQGIGDKEKIVFSVANMGNLSPTKTGTKMILTAFDTRSKDHGFYICNIGPKNYIERLSMAPVFLEDVYSRLSESKFVSNANGYLIFQESASKSANCFFSNDLKTFKQLSDVQPEMQYNWLKTELHTYTDSSGNELQGILYKPENFDSSKKYPLIINIYEYKSNGLNTFILPNLRGVEFNIPILVTNGYLVFLPDVISTPRYGGAAALGSVNAALAHLSGYSWIDTSKMGLVGHSVGGFEVNFIVTHCNRFKAAVSGAGISNMVTAATDLWGHGEEKQGFLRRAVYMMEADVLDDPLAYIRNSPSLFAKNVQTPLLLLHNDKDDSVDFRQTRSFFILLRRLHKPSWWVNYNGAGHGITDQKKKLDWNLKVNGFLDHYLKGTAMPQWMKEHL